MKAATRERIATGAVIVGLIVELTFVAAMLWFIVGAASDEQWSKATFLLAFLAFVTWEDDKRRAHRRSRRPRRVSSYYWNPDSDRGQS